MKIKKTLVYSVMWMAVSYRDGGGLGYEARGLSLYTKGSGTAGRNGWPTASIRGDGG